MANEFKVKHGLISNGTISPLDSADFSPFNLTPRSSAPTGGSVNDIYLDDGTNTFDGNKGLKRLVSTGPNVWEDINSSDINSYINSPMVITGGTLSEGTNAGTYKIAALTAYVRTTDSQTGDFAYVTLAEQDNQAITLADTVYYVALNYNGGSPTISLTTACPYSSDKRTVCLGKVMKDGSDNVHFVSGGFSFQDGILKLHDRARTLRKMELGSGSTIAYSGTNNFTMTSGIVFGGINKYLLSSYDSAVTTFTPVYSNGGGGWTLGTPRNTIDYNHYDDGDGVLGLISVTRYSVHWVYRHVDDGDVYVLYGTGDYKLAEAEIAQEPSKPTFLEDFGLLIGRIVAPETGGSFVDVAMVSDTFFSGTAISDHNEASNLQGGTADEYYHHTANEYSSYHPYLNVANTFTAFQTIDQDSDTFGLKIDSEATTASNYALNVETGAGARNSRFYESANNFASITNEGTNGIGSHWLYRNLPDTTTAGPILYIEQDNASDDQAAMTIQQDGTGSILTCIGGTDAYNNVEIQHGSLLLTRESNSARLIFKSYGAGSKFNAYHANGTFSSPSNTVTNDILFQIGTFGYGATGFNDVNGRIEFVATENYTDTTDGCKLIFRNTLTGTTTLAPNLTIDGDGTLSVNSGLNYETLMSDDDHIPNKKYVDDLSNTGWITLIEDTHWDDQAASTSTITMNVDLTSIIKVGSPIKFTLSGTTYYAICTAITSNLLTIAGAPLTTGDGDLQALYFGPTNKVDQIDILIDGQFADAADSTLIANDLNSAMRWFKGEAYIVQVNHIVAQEDSGATNPNINVTIDGSDVITSDDAVANSWQNTVVDINTSNYQLSRLSDIEITTDAAGTNDDASDLTVSLVIVYA